MNNLQIPIVVVAYDRVYSLKRLLGSLDKCVYPEKVKLIICIDGGAPEEVTSLAEEFHWQHGEKEIICQEENIGLRAHILKCGRLALNFDGIVLLEDDLYVSPYFYQFMLAAQSRYMGNNNISGVALYSPRYSETACLPFTPIEDGTDVYFMQLACSWGQSWLSHQWHDFENWYEDNKSLILQDDESLPPNVRLWPDTSWKKYFIKYNIENNKFFVYPRSSFSTNFADAGTNHSGTKLWQVPLSLGFDNPRFPGFKESFAKYDAFCELLPNSFKKLVPALQDYDFTVDLYGVRDKVTIITNYVISRNEITDHLFSYGCEIKPHELNIIDNIAGEHFKFGKTENMQSHITFLGHRYRIFTNYNETQHYFYSLTKEHYNEFAKDVCSALENDETAASERDEPESNRLRWTANQLESNKNLFLTEFAEGGINYCWSGADPETQFSFSLDRTKELGMYIRLFALIKPEYSKKLKILVDGQHIRHRFILDGSLFVLSCVLPPSSNPNSTQTDVKIILPNTHSPTELGISQDGRKLGIAINEISFGKPESGFYHFLKRLKLKS